MENQQLSGYVYICGRLRCYLVYLDEGQGQMDRNGVY